MSDFRFQCLIRELVTILFVCISSTLMSQSSASILTIREVSDLIEWDMKQNDSQKFGDANFKILNRTQRWGNLIPFPVDSAETFDFFAALFKSVDYLDSLPDSEEQNLRTQFDRSKEPMRIDQLIKSKRFTNYVLSGKGMTIIYAIPLVTLNREVFILQKDFNFNDGYLVKREIIVYKKLAYGNFQLLRSYEKM